MKIKFTRLLVTGMLVLSLLISCVLPVGAQESAGQNISTMASLMHSGQTDDSAGLNADAAVDSNDTYVESLIDAEDPSLLASAPGISTEDYETRFPRLPTDGCPTGGVIRDEQLSNLYKNSTPKASAGISPFTVLPSSVDLSQSKYFPPITNQHGNSCAFWSTTYYQFTYEAARLNNWDAKNNPHYRASPKWSYNAFPHLFINKQGNLDSSGLDEAYIYELLTNRGAARWDEFNYASEKLSYTEDSEWCLDTTVMRNALKTRLSSVDTYSIPAKGRPVTSYESGCLSEVKGLLNNGRVLHIDTYMYSWRYSSDTPWGSVGVMVDGTEGLHAVTVVGYNDNVSVDLNNNGIIEDFERGAFKIANSWGPDRHNQGYIWLMYDALNEISGCSGLNTPQRVPALATNGRPNNFEVMNVENYSLQYTAELSVRCDNQSDMTLLLAKGTLDKNEPIILVNGDFTADCIEEIYHPYFAQWSDYPLGGVGKTNRGTFVFDLYPLCKSGEDITKYKWYVALLDEEKNGKYTALEDFTIKDQYGQIIAQENYRGKLGEAYTLLDGWTMQSDPNKVFTYSGLMASPLPQYRLLDLYGDFTGNGSTQNAFVYRNDTTGSTANFMVQSPQMNNDSFGPVTVWVQQMPSYMLYTYKPLQERAVVGDFDYDRKDDIAIFSAGKISVFYSRADYSSCTGPRYYFELKEYDSGLYDLDSICGNIISGDFRGHHLGNTDIAAFVDDGSGNADLYLWALDSYYSDPVITDCTYNSAELRNGILIEDGSLNNGYPALVAITSRGNKAVMHKWDFLNWNLTNYTDNVWSEDNFNIKNLSRCITAPIGSSGTTEIIGLYDNKGEYQLCEWVQNGAGFQINKRVSAKHGTPVYTDINKDGVKDISLITPTVYGYAASGWMMPSKTFQAGSNWFDDLIGTQAIKVANLANPVTITPLNSTSGLAIIQQPAYGSVVIQNGKLIYTAKGLTSSAGFQYKSGGKTITATIYATDAISRFEETNPSFSYNGSWAPQAITRYSNGSVMKSSTAGSTVTFSFYGTNVNLISYKSYSRGMFTVQLDYGPVETVDLYDPSVDVLYQDVVWEKSGLTLGWHYVTITVLGQKNTASIGMAIDIDAVEINDFDPAILKNETVLLTGMDAKTISLTGVPIITTQPIAGTVSVQGTSVIYTPTKIMGQDSFTYAIGGVSATITLKAANKLRYEEIHPEFKYAGTWAPQALSGYSGKSVMKSSTAGSTFTFDFYGTGIDLISYKSYSRGMFTVQLDDGPVETIDLYDTTVDVLYKNAVWSKSELTAGKHTVVVTILGQKNQLSSGTAVDIDAIDIW